jgi:GTP-binding protein Era
VEALLQAAAKYLPEMPPVFDADDITDRSERFLAAEILREKLFRNLGEELPYGIAVEIEKFEEVDGVRRIHAAIIVDREAHKAMVIGKSGSRLKRIVSDARKDMEVLFGGKVWLETWVKVKSGWADDERALRSLGYE